MITIEHTQESGTLADGTRKGDGSGDILKRHGFRWFPSMNCFGVRHSRDKRANRSLIERAEAALKAAGFEVTVLIDDTPRPVAEAEADRAARADERADRFAGYADNAAGRAEARQADGDRVFDSIPAGQPILIGHHSERADRNRRERAWNNLGHAVEERKRAGYWSSRSDAAASETTHRENIPRTLRRIEELERQRRIYERALAGSSTHGWNAGPEGDPAQREELATRIAELDAKIEYWRGHVAEAEAEGVKVWSREDFAKGDWVKTRGEWWPVLRVNAKSLSVPNKLYEGGPNWIVKYDDIQDRRTGQQVRDAAAANAAREARADPLAPRGVRCGDLLGPYPARITPAPLLPRFSRAVVEQMAGDLAIVCHAIGSDTWVRLDVRDAQVIVEYWAWRETDDSSEVEAAVIVEPDTDGLYAIGPDWEWTLATDTP